MFSLTIRNIKFEYRSRYANRLADMTARRLNCTTKVFVFINIIISLIVLKKKRERSIGEETKKSLEISFLSSLNMISRSVK